MQEITNTGPSTKGAAKGIIEQRVDPERLGRLRVRIAGIHGDEVPTEHLPWCWPRTPAWQDGGVFWIPPIGEYVWITFENGNHEYPTWSGGWWGKGEDGKSQAARGKGKAKHIDWPTSNFGGKAWPKEHILQLEKVEGVRKQDAPNNYTIISPNQKHLEFDDRKEKEKIKLSDQLDNMLWINSERGVTTLEVSEGIRNPMQRKPRGITLSSYYGEIDPETGEKVEDSGLEAVQMYTAAHWYVTLDDLKEVLDINTPGRHRIRVDDKLDRIEFWANSGHHIIIDQVARRIVMRTAQGRTMCLDDERQSISLVGATGEAYMYFDEAAKHMEFRNGEGTMSIKSVGDMNVSCGGRMNLDALGGLYWNSGYFDISNTLTPFGTPYQLPADLEYENPTTGEVSRKVPRAPDYMEALLEPDPDEEEEEGSANP